MPKNGVRKKNLNAKIAKFVSRDKAPWTRGDDIAKEPT
jgi:hypothetical protein